MVMNNCQAVREYVLNFINSLPGGVVQNEYEQTREDGVHEFGRSWIVRKGESESLTARVSDTDDVIEFSLLERNGDTSINILYATLVLDYDDQVLLNVVSESNMDLNFDAKVTYQSKTLDQALGYYAQYMG